jgi:type I restriction enzyme S subunit
MSHEAVMAEIVPNSEPDLPMGWVRTTLGEIAHINRRGTAPRELPDNLLVSFVPMAAVDAERGTIAWQEERPLSVVRKGFTSFSDGDVLFAKITPCMENGKAAVANGLKNGRGFGSTEFHVLTPRDGVASKWIFYFVRQQSVREDAKARFTGTAGQLRVPGSFLVNYPIALAPSAEQQRIVTAIEQYFSRLDAGVATLKVVQAKLKRYRAAVLKAAVEGTLSEAWRAQHPDVEPAPVLLQRILQERRSAWEQAELARFAKAGKAPSKG